MPAAADRVIALPPRALVRFDHGPTGLNAPHLIKVSSSGSGRGTATTVSNRVSRRQANRWAAQEQQATGHGAYEQAQPSDTPPPAVDMDAKLAQLRELGELRSQGRAERRGIRGAGAPDPRLLK